MSYARRNDGLGWRSCAGPDDVGVDETYAVNAPEKTTAQRNLDLWAQIDTLERKEQKSRSVRDLLKKSCAEDAAVIGMTLDQVYALALPKVAQAATVASRFRSSEDY